MAAFLLFFFLSLHLSSSSSSSSNNDQPTTFIVKVQFDAKPSIFTLHKHWYDSFLSSLSSSQTKFTDSPESHESRVIHIYKNVFHGFSAKLSPIEALKIQTLPYVLVVIPERVTTVPFFTNKVVQQYIFGWEEEAAKVVEDVMKNPDLQQSLTDFLLH